MITFKKLANFLDVLGVNNVNQNFEKLQTAHLGVVQTFTLAFPLIAGGGVQNLNALMTSAKIGDGVVVSPQTITAGVVYYGSVVVSGEIRVTAQNVTGAGITPASGSYTVALLKI